MQPSIPTTRPLRLDLACGSAKKPGFFGVDLVATPHVDLVLDLTRTPWPFADGSVDEVHCAHFFEHLTGDQRIDFMHELHRILVPGGKATIIVPYARSDGALQDPTHQWPPLVETSFSYFNAESRRSMGVDHYPIRCDFDFEVGLTLAAEWQHRSEPERLGALRHLWNVASEMTVYLSRR
jgi:SAM-dependent methyltransferase